MTAARVFHALGDPVRLEMVKRLVRDQPCTISQVSLGLGISRQGARKHLQVLVNADLVTLQSVGREVHVQLAPHTLASAKDFIEQIEQRWDQRLGALRRSLEE